MLGENFYYSLTYILNRHKKILKIIFEIKFKNIVK
jgi:hypothetical protein